MDKELSATTLCQAWITAQDAKSAPLILGRRFNPRAGFLDSARNLIKL